MHPRARLLLPGLCLLFGLGFNPAQAENWSFYKTFNYDKPQFLHPHPFAKAHAVLQVSQGSPQRWKMVLNNASNMLKAFGSSNVQIVVVAYGPGLKMLLKDSPFAQRIQSLNAEGVEFDACHNTMLGFKRKLGYMPKLLKDAVVVPGGVVRVMQLQANGFAYIKP